MGYVYLREGKYDEAISFFEKAMEMNPRFYVRAYNNLKEATVARAPRTQSQDSGMKE